MDVGEEEWLDEQQDIAYQYMENTGSEHGEIERTPSFYIAPYVAVWAVESGKVPDAVGWWVITGDLPTDYVSSIGVNSAREAIIAFSRRWSNTVDMHKNGKADPCIALNNETADLLERRAQLLTEWASDESMWQ